MTHASPIGQRIANLDAWLETMRQAGGYAGPQYHWWQSTHLYAGRDLGWSYEGILIGYSRLCEKTDEARWRDRTRAAARDLLDGQLACGSFAPSAFEMNPATFGTPHEAAAVGGLLRALPHLDGADEAIESARKNVTLQIEKLWDHQSNGFNDIPGMPGRVPNKLATLASAFMTFAEVTGESQWLRYAHCCLHEVVSFQSKAGSLEGAIHQMGSVDGAGDGRFFPLYIARCLPALARGAVVFREAGFGQAVDLAIGFLDRVMNPDGNWPQLIYSSGHRAEWPHWIAGTADILLGYQTAGVPIPKVALDRLLEAQAANGAFPTAYGFARQIDQGDPGAVPSVPDAMPSVGWNDKVLRLLAELLPAGEAIPEPEVLPAETRVQFMDQSHTMVEDETTIRIQDVSRPAIGWQKHTPWLAPESRVLTSRNLDASRTHESSLRCLPAWLLDFYRDRRVFHHLPMAWRNHSRLMTRLGTVTTVPAREDLPVALTFDIERDLPGPFESSWSKTAGPFLWRFLEFGAHHSAPATFLVQGEMVPPLAEPLRALVDAGHQIGLHGYRHEFWGAGSWVKHRPPITTAERRDRLQRAVEHFAHAGLPRPVVFRAPNFAIDEESYGLLEQYGFAVDLSRSTLWGTPESPRWRGRLKSISSSGSWVPRFRRSPRFGVTTSCTYPQFDHDALLRWRDDQFASLVRETLACQALQGVTSHLVPYSHNWEIWRDGAGECFDMLCHRIDWLRKRWGANLVLATTLADTLLPGTSATQAAREPLAR